MWTELRTGDRMGEGGETPTEGIEKTEEKEKKKAVQHVKR